YNGAMIDPFQLGLLVVFLATQEVMRKRWTARLTIPAILMALAILLFGGLTYTDVVRYLILVAAAFAEANSGGDVVHLAMIAAFKIQPVFLAVSFLRETWSNQENLMMMISAAFFQMAATDLQIEVPTVLNALAMAWMTLRALSNTKVSTIVPPLLALLSPAMRTAYLDTYRIILIMIGAMILLKERKASSAKKKGAPLLCLALASTGLFNPLTLMAGLLALDPSRKR
nr:nonstructural protein NS2A [Cacipacore virus]